MNTWRQKKNRPATRWLFAPAGIAAWAAAPTAVLALAVHGALCGQKERAPCKPLDHGMAITFGICSCAPYSVGGDYRIFGKGENLPGSDIPYILPETADWTLTATINGEAKQVPFVFDRYEVNHYIWKFIPEEEGEYVVTAAALETADIRHGTSKPLRFIVGPADAGNAPPQKEQDPSKHMASAPRPQKG